MVDLQLIYKVRFFNTDLHENLTDLCITMIILEYEMNHFKMLQGGVSKTYM